MTWLGTLVWDRGAPSVGLFIGSEKEKELAVVPKNSAFPIFKCPYPVNMERESHLPLRGMAVLI